jgi:hypothetical protein
MNFRRAAAVFTLLAAATFASAQGSVRTVLLPDSTLYTIDSKASGQLELSRRRGDVRDTLIVPDTEDDAIESQAQLAFDAATNSVYVMWQHSGDGVDEIRLVSLNATDEWSTETVVANGAQAHRAGLQMVLTHARETGDESDTTLIHAAWWSVGAELVPEYALVAFEYGQYLSAEILDLQTFVTRTTSLAAAEREETGEAEHPPLVMARSGHAIDVVFGADHTTAVTRVHIEPKRISAEARIWRPSGRSTQQTGPAKLVAHSSAPVQAFVSGERVVLYTPDSQFRYSVFANGEWTPVRMIELDENLTSEHLLEELRRTVDENVPLETKPQSE